MRCLTLCFETFTDPNLNVQVMCLHSYLKTLRVNRSRPQYLATGHVFAFNKVNFERQLL